MDFLLLGKMIVTMKKILLISLGLLMLVPVFAQKGAELLQSGPMTGYAAMREAMLWVQTNAPAEVYFEYTAKGQPTHRTATYLTQKSAGYCAHLLADEVEPGLTYTYKLFLNGKEVKKDYDFQFKTPPLWQYRTDPPKMKFALGSCSKVNEEAYDRPGKPYGGGYEIFTHIPEQEPDFMLWLGDYVYLTEADDDSRTGIIKRYTHTRSLPEMQQLLATTANYATWDDHDYGPNNSDRSYIHRSTALEVFKMFWANPTYGIYDTPAAITKFSWGDCDFFMLDNRSFRKPNNRETGGAPTILGEQQREWLIDALVSSRATFKFVGIGGQVLNSTERYENHINLAPAERKYILDMIFAEGIRNVVFLTGDRHHSELSSIRRNGITVYDFTVSPLTSGPHNAEDEPNGHRVEGSHVGIRNFGTVEIEGERTKRKLSFKLFDTEGKELWSKQVEAESWRR
jgi:alkaline phosphatase D